MKIIALSILATLTNARNLTLEEVFGPAPPISTMQPLWQQRLDRRGLPASFLQKRLPDNCVFPIDLVIVQDATASFQDDFDNMATTQLTLLENGLLASHPDSRVGVVSFRDKPIWSLGEPRTDYCQKFELPLADNFDAVRALYAELISTGGGDPPENQFGALVATTQSETPGWDGNPDAARLTVVVTDAAPHFEGDGFNLYGLSVFGGTFDEANAENQCSTEYYPTPTQVRDSLRHRQTYLGAMVYDSQYDNFQPRDSWTWFNNYIQQIPEFYHDINENSSNFWEVLSNIITALEEVECGTASTSPPVEPTVPPVEPTVTPVGTVQTAPATPPPVEPTVTPVGTVQTSPTTAPGEGETLPPSCEVCPNPCPPEGCDPCCLDGVLIKLRHRPARLHLEIENPPADN